jgi:hypothetical protein
VTKHRWFGAALLLAACGGSGGTQQTQPASSAAEAVQSFMRAVADSNTNKMASLWGTASGPASRTRQPPDWERRIVIMQAYLRNDSFRIVSDVPDPDENRRSQQVEIKRMTCTWTVPFVSIKARDGAWLVTQVDLTAAGNPARPCVPGDSAPGSQ